MRLRPRRRSRTTLLVRRGVVEPVRAFGVPPDPPRDEVAERDDPPSPVGAHVVERPARQRVADAVGVEAGREIGAGEHDEHLRTLVGQATRDPPPDRGHVARPLLVVHDREGWWDRAARGGALVEKGRGHNPHQPRAVGLCRPAARVHQKMQHQGVEQRPAGVGRGLDSDSGPQASDPREMPDEGGGSLQALTADRVPQRARLGVDVRRGQDRLADRCRPCAHVELHVDPHPDQPLRVPLREHRQHSRTLGHRNRLVVADEGPVPGQLEQSGLPSDRGEDGLATDAGPLGHGVDGGGGIAMFDEELRGGSDDGAPGGAGLLGAHHRDVGRSVATGPRPGRPSSGHQLPP
jgi:hypothetical protein